MLRYLHMKNLNITTYSFIIINYGVKCVQLHIIWEI